MRTAFIHELMELARTDDDLWLVTGDLGFSVLEPFAAAHPDRYLNAGVAEQSMVGVAAGVASQGATVVVYSIANFPTFRALEQIRNDVAYPGVPVIIVAVGSGFSYGAHGSTHHAIEDLAAMQALPNLTVVSPGDPYEARQAIRQLVAARRPAYLRLGKAGEATLPAATEEPMEVGRHRCLRPGRDLAIFATGSILATAWDAAEALAAQGIDAAVFSAHTLRPFDASTLIEALRKVRGIVTVEEHRAHGGLRTAVAEALLDEGTSADRVVSLAVGQDEILGTGSQDHLRRSAGLARDDIIAAGRRLLS